MLVKFFDTEFNNITNRFWELRVVNKADSDALVKAIVNTFQQHNVPFSNLIQIMPDSPNMIRGPYKGVVTRLKRDYAPHIVNLGGCYLHYVDNAIKMLLINFIKQKILKNFCRILAPFLVFM